MRINGEELALSELKFSEYLKERGLRAEFVALELNGKIVSRAEFETLILKKDDVAELVCFVGGG
ncbi:sulfur carrier protein ThiS [Campylobacter troglodytis]|uniref:sulfur carrier protein ThiS n=1 Tax=Campylobacter troglodytis TaxID=654363 RepID=UPI00115A0721|nr:sulfur carrier protein ThiS [Campylobacter troglodytis]TQR56931.1 thiamine biosynthesis protein ThiS [Campylobacter troglodytis]